MTQTRSNSKRRRPVRREAPNRMDVVIDELEKGPATAVPQQGSRVVSIEKLQVDPQNERRTFDEATIREMADSIRENGIVEPITATPVDDGFYMILSGHRRYHGAKQAGLREVEITIRVPESEHRRRLLSIVSNVQRENVNPVETARGLRYALDNDPEIDTQDDLARRIGKGKAWVSKMLGILKLPAEVLEEVSSTKLAAEPLSEIARQDDPAFQIELVREAKAGASLHTIRDRIAAHQGKPTSRERREERETATTKQVAPPNAPDTMTAPGREEDTAGADGKKPRNKVYLGRGSYDADVIVQSKTADPLTPERQLKVLQAAVRAVKKQVD